MTNIMYSSVMDPPPPPRNKTNFKTIAGFHPDTDIIYVVSQGNTRMGGEAAPEFIAIDVPARDLAEKVGSVMHFLKDRTIGNGDGVDCRGLELRLKQITGSRKLKILKHIVRPFSWRIDPNQPLFELMPRYDVSSPEFWGRRPPAPLGREELVDKIIQRMNATCIRYLDGDPSNCAVKNTYWCDLAVALQHHDEWKVDWDDNLSSDQKAFVHDHSEYFAMVARGMHHSPNGDRIFCSYCGKTDTAEGKPLEYMPMCSRCKQAYYCNSEHQRAHWAEHKKVCRKLAAARENL